MVTVWSLAFLRLPRLRNDDSISSEVLSPQPAVFRTANNAALTSHLLRASSSLVGDRHCCVSSNPHCSIRPRIALLCPILGCQMLAVFFLGKLTEPFSMRTPESLSVRKNDVDCNRCRHACPYTQCSIYRIGGHKPQCSQRHTCRSETSKPPIWALPVQP